MSTSPSSVPAPWRSWCRRTSVLSLLTSAVLGLALVFALLDGREPGVERAAPPQELLGVWTTDDPRYPDRAMEIREDAIVFSVGREEPESHPLLQVRVRESEGRLEVALVYGTHWGESRLQVTVGRQEPTVLRFLNQEEVAWVRAGQDGREPDPGPAPDGAPEDSTPHAGL